MDAPVYQDLSWQRYGALDSQQPSSQHQPQQQQTIKHTYRAQLEQKRDRIIQVCYDLLILAVLTSLF